MSITGTEEAGTYRVGYPVCDTIGGMTAAFAIAGALAQGGPKRNVTGEAVSSREGCFIDVSMLEATISTMGWVVSNYLMAEKDPKPMGNENFTASPSGTFKTKDKPINIAANKQEQFEAICDIIGLPVLKNNPLFQERQSRLQHRVELNELIEAELKKQDAAHWLEQMSHAGIPAGPVLSVSDTLSHEQIVDRNIIQEFPEVEGVDRAVRVLKTGFKLNGETPSVSSPPPTLGEHNEEILGALRAKDGT